MSAKALLDKNFGVVDYAVYQAYKDSGKRDERLFRKFSDNAMDVLTKTGTILIDNAPVTAAKPRMLQAAMGLFELPAVFKKGLVFKNHNDRGYIPYGTKKPEDYKNIFHVDKVILNALTSASIGDVRTLKDKKIMERMLQIGEKVPDFNEAAIEFSHMGAEMGHAFCEVVANHFDLSPDDSGKMKTGNHLLRMLQYMPFDKEKLKEVKGATRAKPHADISAFTFLVTSDQPGLKIVPKNTVFDLFGTNFISNGQMQSIPAKHWLNVPTKKTQCVMNIGRPMEILTNGILPATPHKVVPVRGKENQQRFSVPFFYHMPWDMPMRPFDKAIAMRQGINYFEQEQRGLWQPSVGDYLICDNIRDWIKPTRPVPVYQP